MLQKRGGGAEAEAGLEQALAQEGGVLGVERGLPVRQERGLGLEEDGREVQGLAHGLLLRLHLRVPLLRVVLVVARALLRPELVPRRGPVREGLLREAHEVPDEGVAEDARGPRLEARAEGRQLRRLHGAVGLLLDGVHEAGHDVVHQLLHHPGGDGPPRNALHEGRHALGRVLPHVLDVRELQQRHQHRDQLLHERQQHGPPRLQHLGQHRARQRLLLQRGGLDADPLLAEALEGEGQALHPLLGVLAILVGDGDVGLQ
mmetsp:Transcript_5981/g.11131  ORF Transcript_5981/g.11131 Transcript_5981/m.11131 type:complete len:260 (+) Transcript_5981:1574-2353(+)